jgi:hypothetical protein
MLAPRAPWRTASRSQGRGLADCLTAAAVNEVSVPAPRGLHQSCCLRIRWRSPDFQSSGRPQRARSATSQGEAGPLSRGTQAAALVGDDGLALVRLRAGRIGVGCGCLPTAQLFHPASRSSVSANQEPETGQPKPPHPRDQDGVGMRSARPGGRRPPDLRPRGGGSDSDGLPRDAAGLPRDDRDGRVLILAPQILDDPFCRSCVHVQSPAGSAVFPARPSRQNRCPVGCLPGAGLVVQACTLKRVMAERALPRALQGERRKE